ncbi:hypothetical protein BJX66DRAFT_341407 [Aspergillus keveii]|uniref:GPI anchored protein n=1 Tax=Aspergillus keveii TaxID=714993 RepID=A0ABR4FVG7_9EURO
MGLVPLGVAAQECGSSSSVNSVDISSQEDLDALQSDCTILLSPYTITPEFSGPFVLPGIVNISKLSTGSDGSREPINVPSIEMPDLVYAKDLFLHRLDSLETFSVPKLATLGWATVDIPSHIDTFEMPALEESVGGMSLMGNLTDVSFPALHTVTMGDLIIQNSHFAVEPETSMNISLPALNSSESIFINGRASRIYLPELTYLASPWITGSGSNFSLWGETIELDLPKLHTVDGSIYFEGNITSLSLPSLDWVDKNLTVTAGNPLAVDIPELGYAKVIRLSGKIKSAELPGLNNWSELHVDTDLAFDCDAFMEKYDRLPTMRLVTCVSRGEVEDSDAPNDSIEESTSTEDESSPQEDESATAGEEDTGDEEQTGDDNGSAHMHATGVGAVLVTFLVVFALIGI